MLEVVLFDNRLGLDADVMSSFADCGVFFVASAGVSHRLVYSFIKSYGGTTFSPPVPTPVAAVFSSCVAIVALTTSFTLVQYGREVGTLSRSDIYSDENAALSLFRGVTAIMIPIAAAFIRAQSLHTGQKYTKQWHFLFFLLFIYATTDLVVLGDRRLPLVAILAALLATEPKRISFRYVLLAALGATLLVFYGFVRGNPVSDWAAIIRDGDVLGAFSPAANEFGGIAIIASAISDLSALPRDFPSYVDAFSQLVPRSLHPARPPSPTEWFVSTYFPALASMGASFAFNAVIEAIANWGLTGVFLGGWVTGAVMGAITTLTFRGVRVGIPLATYVFVFSMRMDFASQIRTTMVAIFGLLIMVIGVFAFQLAFGRPVSQRQSQ
jgi:hypothetical protein